MAKTILFSVHEFDADGDIIEHGIYLHFGDIRIRVGRNLNDFKDFAKVIQDMIPEIEDAFNFTTPITVVNDVEIGSEAGKQIVSEDIRDFYGKLLGQPLDIETTKTIVAEANKLFPSWVIIRMDWAGKDSYCAYAFDEKATPNLTFNSRDIAWDIYDDCGSGFGVFDLVLPEGFVDCATWGIDRSSWENFMRVEEGAKMLDSVR